MTLAVSSLDRAVVLGLDPSLKGLGYAWSPSRAGSFVPGDMAGLQRMRWLRLCVRQLVAHLREHGPLHLAVIEGPAYGVPQQRGQHERAGLWWALLDDLTELDVPIAVAPPAQVKMLALGKGGGKDTDKVHVTIAARERLPGFALTDHNAADAAWLAELGYQRLGHPHVRLPALHTRALTGVAWPT